MRMISQQLREESRDSTMPEDFFGARCTRHLARSGGRFGTGNDYSAPDLSDVRLRLVTRLTVKRATRYDVQIHKISSSIRPL